MTKLATSKFAKPPGLGSRLFLERAMARRASLEDKDRWTGSAGGLQQEFYSKSTEPTIKSKIARMQRGRSRRSCWPRSWRSAASGSTWRRAWSKTGRGRPPSLKSCLTSPGRTCPPWAGPWSAILWRWSPPTSSDLCLTSKRGPGQTLLRRRTSGWSRCGGTFPWPTPSFSPFSNILTLSQTAWRRWWTNRSWKSFLSCSSVLTRMRERLWRLFFIEFMETFFLCGGLHAWGSLNSSFLSSMKVIRQIQKTSDKWR